MLNWRRDPDYERRMNALRSDTAQIRRESEQIKRETDQIRKETEQIRRETEQIRKETEQIRKENELLREQNARGRELLASIDALCLEDDSSSTPAPPMPSVTAPFSP
jgi:methyl-accepting chemotaxis protein